MIRDHDGEPLLDAATTALALGISVGLLRLWKHRGVIHPVARKGPRGSSLYRRADIERLLAGRRSRGVTSEPQ